MTGLSPHSSWTLNANRVRRLNALLVPSTRLIEDEFGSLSPVAVENVPFRADVDRGKVIWIVRRKLPQVTSLVPAAGDELRVSHQEAEPPVADPGLSAVRCPCEPPESARRLCLPHLAYMKHGKHRAMRLTFTVTGRGEHREPPSGAL